MIDRALTNQVLSALQNFPAVALLGPRQSGKTTLAHMLHQESQVVIYLDLELPSDWNRLQQAEIYLQQHADKLVIIDEVQRLPTLFPLLRALIDQQRRPGRFLLLGSSSLDLVQHASESLAGRIKTLELTPLILSELDLPKDGFSRLWLRGGFPDSYLARDEQMSFSWRQAFVRTYLEKEIAGLGLRIPPPQLLRFWQLLAHSHGQLWNASLIARSLGLSSPTIRHYLDILQETFMVRCLTPYYSNVKKRLVKSPKIMIRDSGILHCLLNITSFEDLSGHMAIGHSWEGFAVEQIAAMLPQQREQYFYRTSAGAELDLIILDCKQKPIALEMKYSLAPQLGRGFTIAFADLKCERGFVVYPGTEVYPIRNGVQALPLTNLKPLLDLM